MEHSEMKVFSVMWSTDTAGPSPDKNKRTELFLMGCKKAVSGNPCQHCFNPSIWEDKTNAVTYTPQFAADQIEMFAPNKYVTFSGGEPTDQIEPLAETCKLLKAKGFHIMVYTWKTIQAVAEMKDGIKLLSSIDILVDGEYDRKERLYNSDMADGFLSSVGSGNQTIWDLHEYNNSHDTIVCGNKASEIAALHIKKATNELVYVLKNDSAQELHTVILMRETNEGAA